MNSHYYVILSHHSLANDFIKRGISNREEVRKILEERNKKDRKILFCMNGHYQNVTPKDIGMGQVWNGVSVEPITKSTLLER